MKPKDITITLSANHGTFKRWEIIKVASNGSTSLITHVSDINNGQSMTCKPYRVSKYWLIRLIKFNWVRLTVWVGDMYKKYFQKQVVQVFYGKEKIY